MISNLNGFDFLWKSDYFSVQLNNNKLPFSGINIVA